MRTGSLLLSVAAALLLASSWVAASRDGQIAPTPSSVSAPVTAPRSAGYVGSEACQA